MLRSLFIILLLASFTLCAQEKLNRKFGDVTLDDLNKSSYAIDSQAHAVILFDKGESDFDGNNYGWISIEFKRHRRIHILHQSAFDFATLEIELYAASTTSEEKIFNLEANAYNIENGAVVKTKMKDESVFKEKSNKYYNTLKFTIPNVKVGTIIEYSYTIKSPQIFLLKNWEFQHEIPTLWSEYRAIIPSFFGYVMNHQGFHPFHIKSKESYPRTYKINQSDSQTSASDWVTFNTNADTYRWVMKDLPPVKKAPYLTSTRNYISKLDFQLSDYLYPLTPRRILTTWEKLNQELLNDNDFGKSMKLPREVEQEIDLITKASSTPLDKAKIIYHFVQDKYTSNSSMGSIYLLKNFKKINEEKSGSSNNINLFLVAALKYAGLNADPVLCSERWHGLINSFYPMLDKFNKVIATVKLDGKMYYLDASDKLLPFGIVDEQTINGYARLIGDDAKALNINPDSFLRKEAIALKLALDGTVLKGSVEYKPSAYQSIQIRKKYKDKQDDYFKTYSSKGDLKIISSTIDSISNIDLPVVARFSYEQSVDDDSLLYINPMMFALTKDNPFKDEKRTLPIEFNFLQDENSVFNMYIPKGYKVLEMPKSQIIKNNDTSEMTLEYKASENNGMIYIRSRLKINKCNFEQEKYEDVKKFYNYVLKKHEELIVLKKI